MSFRFSLQRLLDLRSERERAMAREVMTARDEAEEQRLAHGRLQAAKAAAEERLASETVAGPTIGTLVSLSAALSHFSEHVSASDERTRAAEAMVQERQDALALAAQARRMLDRLRNRHESEFQQEARAHERRTMDELALTRFSKTPDPSANSRQSPSR